MARRNRFIMAASPPGSALTLGKTLGKHQRKGEGMATRSPGVHIVATGGTIAGVAPHRLDYYQYGEAGKFLSIEEILDRIPEARDIAEITAENLLSVGSSNMGPKEWLLMAKRINQVFREEPDVAGVVVTHGTATLEETAYFLHLTVKSNKPVVITGSMRPPTTLGTDAELNLLDAIRIAAHPESVGKGVLTVLNNQIHSGRDVTKTNTLRLETFRPNDLGFLGYVDSDFQVVFYRTPLRKHTTSTEFDVTDVEQLPRVDIVYSYAGSDGTLIKAAQNAGAQGLIVAGYGTGSISDEMLSAAIEAVQHGSVVVRASRAFTGRVVTTPKNENLGLLASDDLLPQKARILLMLALTVTSDHQRIQHMFYQH